MQKSLTKRLNKVLAIVLTIAALAVGQSVWATTKTVTYKITSVNRNSSFTAYEIVFTRQNDATRTDDDPFDTSAPTTYTTSVLIGSIENNQSGYFSVVLADGFQLNSSWSENSTVRFASNCIYPSASDKYITYSVSCSNDNYYVTHVMMTGHNSNYQQGLLQPFPNLNDPIDYDYSSEWHFSQSYRSCYAFGQITITYTDVPLLSIFESDGENAYKIKDKYDLRHLAAYVNNGGNNCSGLTFRQTQAIACDGNFTGEGNFTPIGYRFSNSNRSYFKGTYDGQGHTVSGITVSRTGGSDADGCIGLFGYVEYGGTVQNVVLASSTFTGNDKIGGIVGLNWGGTVKNCRVESSVTIKAGCNNAWNHGGIVGYNDSGTIEGCVSAASIVNNGKSSHQFCGGITGRTSSTIRDCLYTGTTIEAADYKGAICGYSDGGATYANNYYTAIALGGVGAEGGSSDQDGARRARTVTLGTNVALVGNETTYEIQNHSSLTAIGTSALRYNNTLYSGATQTLNLRYSGEALATGYAAIYSVDGTRIARSTFEVPAGDVGVTVAVADVWGVSGTPAADGSADHPYTISSTYGLDLLAKNVNGTDGYTAADFSGQHFLQTAPITYDGTENNYTPIGNSSHYFKGHYDGGGETISGININHTGQKTTYGYKGIFGNVDGGNVHDVVLAESTITSDMTIGGIVGRLQNNGTVQNCRVESTVTINTGSEYSCDHGGIAGSNENSSVIGCLSAATLNRNNKFPSMYGGIVGHCYNGTVKDCLYTGTTVEAQSMKGAIVGTIANGSTLTNNYYSNIDLGAVNGNDTDGARLARTVTLGEHVALVGSETLYNRSGLTAIGTGNYALSHGDGNTTTIYSGATQALTLSYTDEVPGNHILRYKYNDGSDHAIDGNSFTMPGANVSVSAILTPVYALTFSEDGITTTTPPAVTDNGIGYYAAGTEIILDYTIPSGYVFNRFTSTAGSIHNGNILTMEAQDATVSVYKSAKWGINNENDGSETKPYIISSDDELNLLSDCVNGTTGYAHYDAHDFTGKYFKVDDFIPYSEKLYNNFITIGTNGKEFNGTFDGNNKVIKSIRITDSSASHQGLFGYIGTSGTVKNVLLEDAVIINPSATSTVGVIAAHNDGTLTDNYYFGCKINIDSLNIGTSGGDVNINDGAVSMHIVTPGEGVVVTGSKHFYINDSSSSFDTGDNFYPRGSTITLSPAEGYLVGSGYTVTKEKFKSNNPNLDPGTEEDVPVTENAGGYSFTVPAGRVVVGNLVPDIATYWHADDDHDGTSEARAYIISNTTGLNILASHVNYGNDCSGIFFRLGADIAYDPNITDENGINFQGIGGGFHTRSGVFSGSFDGQGYTISGIRINRTQDDVGLFGRVDNVGTVKNVILSDARITGGNNTGGIVGANNGFVKNCVAVGTTIIKKEKYNYGVIVGMTSRPLSNNYYFNCSLGGKYDGIGTGKSEDSDDEYYNDGAIPVSAFPLLCTGINDHVFATNYNVPNKDFTIAGRTLYEDGDWNTLCLPFSLSAEQIAAHERFAGADIRELSSASVNDGTLTLNFTAKGAVTSIQTGVPYIIKWTKPADYDEGYNHAFYDIKDATFTGVTITSTTPGAVTSTDGKVTFQGTYGYTEYTNEDRSVLFLGTQNRLYYPKPALNDPTQPFDADYNPWIYPSIGAFRAYFKLNDTNAPNLNIVLNFGDGETTEVKEVNEVIASLGVNDNSWYTINGVKLQGKPTQKGVYINGGRKVVIK